ncbi:MAG: AEC family transporter [Candidatus Peribacteraceae bacterium]|nr:AEC family transporter [Candidatus Peribacteraceae bacterium]
MPLYILIGFGYVAGKTLKASKETVVTLLLYIILPVVTFHAIAEMELSANLLLLPVIFYLMGVLLCCIFYVIGTGIWKDSTKNLLAFGAGMGNTGYFGLPLILAVLGEKAFVIAVLLDLGTNLYQCTFGCFIAAKGNFTVRESLIKVFRLPTIYALAAAILWNRMGFTIPAPLEDLGMSMRGAYIVLGMMLIGVALGDLKRFAFDWAYLVLAFAAKYAAWPLAAFSFVWIDRHALHLFPELAREAMLILSLTPMAGNTVSYATELRIHPEKAAAAVLFSTLFALFFIPAVLMFF